jgi:predicted RNA-binding protein Jag
MAQQLPVTLHDRQSQPQTVIGTRGSSLQALELLENMHLILFRGPGQYLMLGITLSSSVFAAALG